MNPVPFLAPSDKRLAEWLPGCLGKPLRDWKKVVAYLRNGVCVAAVPAIIRDPFYNNEIIQSDSPNLYTDGSWVWWGHVAYWVEYYDFELPSAFVSHVRKLRYKRPRNARSRYHKEYPPGSPGPWQDGLFLLPDVYRS